MTDKKEVEQISDKEVRIEEFSSERVKVEVKHEPRCLITFRVTANAELAKDAKKAAIKSIAKEVSIPGFRKGKAPADIIEGKFPRDVTQQWEKEFANKAFQEGQELAQIPLLNGNGNITYKVEELNLESGKIHYNFESEPVVPEIPFSQLKLKNNENAVVDDARVDETIRNIQMFYAKWEQVEDRGIQMGDFIVLDIDDLDQDPPVQAFSNTRFEVTEKGMAKWMQDLLLGKKKGDFVDGVSKPDSNESEEVKNSFKEKKVRLHIKGIEEAHLPQIDDELAKRVGATSADHMREQLKNLLTKQSEEALLKELRDSVCDQLLATLPFDIPASILEKEANHRMNQLMRHADFSKKWKEEMTEEEKSVKKAEVVSQSDHAIRLFYICRKIVSENNIRLSEEEINPSHESILEMMFADPARLNYRNQSKEQQAVEFSKFMMAKAQDFIIQKIRAESP
jgi:trigger factor